MGSVFGYDREEESFVERVTAILYRGFEDSDTRITPQQIEHSAAVLKRYKELSWSFFAQGEKLEAANSRADELKRNLDGALKLLNRVGEDSFDLQRIIRDSLKIEIEDLARPLPRGVRKVYQLAALLNEKIHRFEKEPISSSPHFVRMVEQYQNEISNLPECIVVPRDGKERAREMWVTEIEKYKQEQLTRAIFAEKSEDRMLLQRAYGPLLQSRYCDKFMNCPVHLLRNLGEPIAELHFPDQEVATRKLTLIPTERVIAPETFCALSLSAANGQALMYQRFSGDGHFWGLASCEGAKSASLMGLLAINRTVTHAAAGKSIPDFLLEGLCDAHFEISKYDSPCQLAINLVLPNPANNRYLWIGLALGHTRLLTIANDGTLKDLSPLPAETVRDQLGGSLSDHAKRQFSVAIEELDAGTTIVTATQGFSADCDAYKHFAKNGASALAKVLMAACLQAGKPDTQETTLAIMRLPP
jgi:hypothetical protein